MSAKRALIVDDSRSARVILGRMLESYGLQVDLAESAEHALDYLSHTRPDAIFMDHLMPGMDGFQAIQAIKSNPDTALIPVVMYTSQEGELYVSQARALGAVGVLPKTVKQSDVSRVLYQLRLLPERRDATSVLVDAPPEERTAPTSPTRPAATPSNSELESAVRRAIAPALAEHSSEIRRAQITQLDSFAKRLVSELKAAAPSEPAHTPLAEPAPPPSASPPARRGSWAAVAAVLLALLPTAVLAYFYLQTQHENRTLSTAYTQLAAALQTQQSQLDALQVSLRTALEAQTVATDFAAATVETEIVPYGEIPFAGARAERLRALADELHAEAIPSKIQLHAFTGDFCLVGNSVAGYSLAADDLPVKRCDVVGNPYDEALGMAQRQSVAFANLLASLRQRGNLEIELLTESRRPEVPYPQAEHASAGEWNRAAARNQRVEFVVTRNPASAELLQASDTSVIQAR